MSEAVYVRFDAESLDFVKSMVKADKITRSEAIKKLVSYAAEKLKVEKAVTKYKDGQCTIREAAQFAGLRYFEFFEVLAKNNLIGTDADNTEVLLERMKEF